MPTYTITLPLPPRECSPNFSGSWRSKAAYIKAYRTICTELYRKEVKVKRWPRSFTTPITIHLRFYYGKEEARYTLNKSGRKVYFEAFCRDASNARGSWKNGQDALQDAGLIVSDHHKYVQDGTTELFTTQATHQGRRCVDVIIEEAT